MQSDKVASHLRLGVAGEQLPRAGGEVDLEVRHGQRAVDPRDQDVRPVRLRLVEEAPMHATARIRQIEQHGAVRRAEEHGVLHEPLGTEVAELAQPVAAARGVLFVDVKHGLGRTGGPHMRRAVPSVRTYR